MMHGTIEQAQMSKSGKTLRIKVGGTWYSTNNFALQQAIGRNVQFEVGTSEYMGNTIYWANDAELVTDVGMDVPANVPAPRPQQAAQSPSGTDRDRDASIIAQALTKACTAPGDSGDTVWARYCFFYYKALAGEKPPAESHAAPPEFDDDIPF